MSNTFFQRGKKIFSTGFAPLVTGLINTNEFSFSEMLRKEHTCDRVRKSCTTVEWVRWRDRMKVHENYPPQWRAGCAPGANRRSRRSRYKQIHLYRTDLRKVSGPIRIKLKSYFQGKLFILRANCYFQGKCFPPPPSKMPSPYAYGKYYC